MRYLIIFLLQLIVSNIIFSQNSNRLLNLSIIRCSYKEKCTFFEVRESQVFGFGNIIPEKSEIYECNSYRIIDSVFMHLDCKEFIENNFKLEPLTSMIDPPVFVQILDSSYTRNEKIVNIFHIDNQHYILVISSTQLYNRKRSKRLYKKDVFTIVNLKLVNDITEILLVDPMTYPKKRIENIEVYKTSFNLKNNPIAFVKVGWKTTKRKKTQYEVANIDVYHLRE
jgi:hypothetical protein